MNQEKIKSVSMIGMGALGLLYGGFITEHAPDIDLKFVMDEKRYQTHKNHTVLCNGIEKEFPMIPAEEAAFADLVIVAVKYNGLYDAIDLMKPCVGPDTVIISVMNGISSEEIIGGRYGMEKMIYTVAQGMDAMKFGNRFQYSQMGRLHIGAVSEQQNENLKRIKNFFHDISMPYVEENDIKYRIWSKFMLNVGVNQTCMVYGTTYSGVLKKGEANRIMISAMREVIALAHAENIGLSENDINQYIEILKTLKPDNSPSMGQDRINRKPSEVEMFAGTVIKLAQKYQIYVPVNEFLYDKVKEIESAY